MGWRTDSVVVHHVYPAVGTYSAKLYVQRAGTTAPVDSATQTVIIVGPVWVHISGHDYIAESGTYEWTSQPHDGAPEYGPYAWYYQEGGSAESQVGTRAVYSLYVSATGQPYTFRLRNTVEDAIPNSAVDTLWVDVVPGDDAPSRLGLLTSAGTCRLQPAGAAARRAAHAAMAQAGRWPVPCLVSKP